MRLNYEQMTLLRALSRLRYGIAVRDLAFNAFGSAFGIVAYCQEALPRLAKRGLVYQTDERLWRITDAGVAAVREVSSRE